MGNQLIKAAGSASAALTATIGKNIPKETSGVSPPVATGLWQSFIRADAQSNLGQGKTGGLPLWEKVPTSVNPLEASTPKQEFDPTDPEFFVGEHKDDKLVRELREELYHPAIQIKYVDRIAKEQPWVQADYSFIEEGFDMKNNPNAIGEKGPELGIRLKRTSAGSTLPKIKKEGSEEVKEDGHIDFSQLQRIFNLALTPIEVCHDTTKITVEEVEKIRFHCQHPITIDNDETQQRSVAWIGNYSMTP